MDKSNVLNTNSFNNKESSAFPREWLQEWAAATLCYSQLKQLQLKTIHQLLKK